MSVGLKANVDGTSGAVRQYQYVLRGHYNARRRHATAADA